MDYDYTKGDTKASVAKLFVARTRTRLHSGASSIISPHAVPPTITAFNIKFQVIVRPNASPPLHTLKFRLLRPLTTTLHSAPSFPLNLLHCLLYLVLLNSPSVYSLHFNSMNCIRNSPSHTLSFILSNPSISITHHSPSPLQLLTLPPTHDIVHHPNRTPNPTQPIHPSLNTHLNNPNASFTPDCMNMISALHPTPSEEPVEQVEPPGWLEVRHHMAGISYSRKNEPPPVVLFSVPTHLHRPAEKKTVLNWTPNQIGCLLKRRIKPGQSGPPKTQKSFFRKFWSSFDLVRLDWFESHGLIE